MTKNSLNLWSGAAPGALGDGAADMPTLQVIVPVEKKHSGASFIVCPGGGYGHLAPHEAEPVGRWFADLGATAFVLRYRLGPKYHHPVQLGDAQRAIRLVRARAGHWRLDPRRIGIMGFSAGGHLASSAATHYTVGDTGAADPIERVSSRPDLQILIYPVITMGPGGHAGSRQNLLGENPPADLIELLSSEKRVTADTPPAFLMHSTADAAVPVGNADAYAVALKAAGVACEYVRGDLGPHGIGMDQRWTPQCSDWLGRMGWLG